MQIVRSQQCSRHNEQVNFMCTDSLCFKNQSIMVCKLCFKEHMEHPAHLIERNLLNARVGQLMQKRMQYEEAYDLACDRMITELKIFKSFKEQVVTSLNMRQRELNEICKKIRRHIRYEKDETLFKCAYGQIYLSMRALNENLDLYTMFRKSITEVTAELRKSLIRVDINLKQQNLLLSRKDHQICELVKSIPDQQLTPQIRFSEPIVKGLKKQIIRFKFKDEMGPNILRLSDNEFITFSNRHEIAKLYNSNRALLPPRILLLGSPIENMVMMGKNAFCSLEGGGIKIYDLLREKVVKDFACSNQKSAKIANLLAVSGNSVFSFISSPNQIVNFRFNDARETLEVIKGFETKFKVSKSLLLQDQFFTVCDDFRIRGFTQQCIQQTSVIKFDAPVRTMTRYNSQSLLVGGEFNRISLVDLRTRKPVNQAKINSFCKDLQKITDNCVIYSWGRAVSMMDIRMLKDVMGAEADGGELHAMRAINSNLFVTSGNALHLWHLVS